jgi:phosphoribosylformylglycinamidine synthase
MAIFRKWDLDFSVIGKVTDTKHLTLRHKGEVVGDIPIGPLVDDAPNYDRPHEVKPAAFAADTPDIPAPDSLGDALAQLMGGHHLSSRRWIWEQYDHQVMGDTVVLPGGDAGVVRVHGTDKALATATDCTPRYCYADPVEGGKQAVAETWRNISAVGATPLAITNCLNFGNPEKPEIMSQFVGCIQGIAEACKALDYPVVSGNVSLYNETNGQAVLPTPAIGGVGLIQDYTKLTTIAFKSEREAVFIIGETQGHLTQSIYARDLIGVTTGAAPIVDLVAEKKHSEFIRTQIDQGNLTACHDVSDGGALVALAEMAMAGHIGMDITHDAGHDFWFGEDQGRYIVTTNDAESLTQAASAANVPLTHLGTTGGDTIASQSVASLVDASENWMPNYMAAP